MDFNSFLAQPWDLFVRILVAAAYGGILGIERDIHGRGAGLRTHLLVSAGAALFMILSTHAATFDAVRDNEVVLINYDVERDFEAQTTSIRMYLRLFYKDSADKMSCLIIDKLEKSQTPLKAIRWLRP
jgi:hypothetical protein